MWEISDSNINLVSNVGMFILVGVVLMGVIAGCLCWCFVFGCSIYIRRLLFVLADDTLCVGEATIENLWTLKALLRGFEMVSGLKVNFQKSFLIGVNVLSEFMGMELSFLNCSEATLPFMYLGLPVGANARKLSTWEPVLERLNAWGNKYIGLGGRIVLLISVPIFYLSFLKMPIKVIKKLVAIQRKFLWGGVGGSNQICCVRWRKVCQPRTKGGLGVRDLKLANVSLLAKWRWRLLDGERSLWKEVLEDKYGPRVSYKSRVVGETWPWFASR